MKLLSLFILSIVLAFFQEKAWSKTAEGGSLKSDAELFENVDTFYDPTIDYSRFLGRVTDRDESGNIIKIESENKNVKLFRAGDILEFKVARLETKDSCTGYVRDIEGDYLIVFVKDFFPCWGQDDYFRRGTQLNFHSPMLKQRVVDASLFRVILLKRKRDFLRQLNDINHFVWSYEQKRVQMASEYDQKIAEIEKEKAKALDFLASKKKDSINLQRELSYRLDKLDKDIDFYRVEKVELLKDRWNTDHELGHPLGNRPQEMKPKFREAYW